MPGCRTRNGSMGSAPAVAPGEKKKKGGARVKVARLCCALFVDWAESLGGRGGLTGGAARKRAGKRGGEEGGLKGERAEGCERLGREQRALHGHAGGRHAVALAARDVVA